MIKHFQSLVELVKKLRGPDGCPWDQEQTQASLARYAVEEACELSDAIQEGNQKEIAEELGDFLFQVILQAQVAEDEGYFNLSEVIETVNEKMIRRHPHVFDKKQDLTSSEVLRNWDEIKKQEQVTKTKPVFSYPKSLPALHAAHKIGTKTETYGFDWKTPTQVLEKVKEELEETIEAIDQKNTNKIEAEIGDLLFSVAQLARHCGLEPESCLRRANRRFEGRFLGMLKLHGGNKDSFKALSDTAKESLWNNIKKQGAADE